MNALAIKFNYYYFENNAIREYTANVMNDSFMSSKLD